jgi:predicted nucleic acid-binding protein
VIVVVDASALVELLLRTPTGFVVEHRLRTQRPRVPDIIDAEVSAALRRARRQGALADEQLQQALGLLLDWPAVRVPTRALVRRSRRWWGNVSVYDALYLAVADAEGAGVLTCDGRLSRAPGTGVPVENVRVT